MCGCAMDGSTLCYLHAPAPRYRVRKVRVVVEEYEVEADSPEQAEQYVAVSGDSYMVDQYVRSNTVDGVYEVA